MKKIDKPPFTNRGVESTLNLNESYMFKGNFNDRGGIDLQFVLIDWLQFTILSDSFSYFDENGCFLGVKDIRGFAADLFVKFFKVNYSDLVFEYKGINGYNCCYSFKNIFCYFHTTRYDMGINFKLSGEGCRDFESLGLDYIDLFKSIYSYSFRFSRIDISVDDFSGKFFTLDKLVHYCRCGHVSTKFKSFIDIQKFSLSKEGRDSDFLGRTLQFGSKASNVQVTFYDKKKERESQSFEVDSSIKFWLRTEVRYRHELADSVVCLILKDSLNINYLLKSTLKSYIDFKDLNYKDSKVCRIPTAKFWTRFLDIVDSLKLTNYLPESNIVKKSLWLNYSISKSNLMVLLGELDNLRVDEISSDYLLDFLKNGLLKFTYKDLSIINEYRRSKGLELLSYSQVCDYVKDLREVSLFVNVDSSIKQHNIYYRKLHFLY